MYSVRRTAAFPAVGFPIRTSPDQSLVSGSPTLFAATHVLLRLLSPRHPSCALCSLVISLVDHPSRLRVLLLLSRSTKTRVQRGVVNHLARPQHLPTCAYAIFKDRVKLKRLVEPIGIEPTTSSLQSWRSPS